MYRNPFILIVLISCLLNGVFGKDAPFQIRYSSVKGRPLVQNTKEVYSHFKPIGYVAPTKETTSEQPEIQEPETHQSEIQKPDTQQSEIQKSETHQSEIQKPDTQQSEIQKPQTHQSDIKYSEKEHHEVQNKNEMHADTHQANEETPVLEQVSQHSENHQAEVQQYTEENHQAVVQQHTEENHKPVVQQHTEENHQAVVQQYTEENHKAVVQQYTEENHQAVVQQHTEENHPEMAQKDSQNINQQVATSRQFHPPPYHQPMLFQPPTGFEAIRRQFGGGIGSDLVMVGLISLPIIGLLTMGSGGFGNLFGYGPSSGSKKSSSKRTRRSLKDKAADAVDYAKSLWNIMEQLEKAFEKYDLYQAECRLRVVCEAHHKDRRMGSWGQSILDLMRQQKELEGRELLPVSRFLFSNYAEAAQAGARNENCAQLYTGCPRHLSYYLSAKEDQLENEIENSM